MQFLLFILNESQFVYPILGLDICIKIILAIYWFAVTTAWYKADIVILSPATKLEHKIPYHFMINTVL